MDTAGANTDWGADTIPTNQVVAAAGAQMSMGGIPPSQASQPVTAPPTGFGDGDWMQQPATTTTKDWAADDGDWGSAEPVSGLRDASVHVQ